MISILREYSEDGIQVTEYTRDGENISHTVRAPIQEERQVLGQPQPETTDQKITRLEQQVQSDNLIIFEALAEIYAVTVGGVE